MKFLVFRVVRDLIALVTVCTNMTNNNKMFKKKLNNKITKKHGGLAISKTLPPPPGLAPTVVANLFFKFIWPHH